ncbi:hypothetical protein AVEN_1965-1, partial [Araneus ventricosus]
MFLVPRKSSQNRGSLNRGPTVSSTGTNGYIIAFADLATLSAVSLTTNLCSENPRKVHHEQNGMIRDNVRVNIGFSCTWSASDEKKMRRKPILTSGSSLPETFSHTTRNV